MVSQGSIIQVFGCNLVFYSSPKVERSSSTGRWQPKRSLKKPVEDIRGSTQVWSPLDHLEINLFKTIFLPDPLFQMPSLSQLQRAPDQKAWSYLYFLSFWHTPYLNSQAIIITLPPKYSQDLDPLLRAVSLAVSFERTISYYAHIWLLSSTTLGHCSNVTLSVKPSLTIYLK